MSKAVCCRVQHLKMCVSRRVSKSGIGICIKLSVIPPFCLCVRCLGCITKWSKSAAFRLTWIRQRGRNTIYIYRAGLVVGPKKVQQGRPNFLWPRATRGQISGIRNCQNNGVIFIVYSFLVMWPRAAGWRLVVCREQYKI